jgi:hypothetical protein
VQWPTPSSPEGEFDHTIASNTAEPLAIPDAHSEALASVLGGVLQLDVLSDPAVLKDNGIELLSDRLRIERLSALSFARDYFIPRYNDMHVTDSGGVPQLP